MTIHATYDTITGEIQGVLSCPDYLLEINRGNLPPGQNVIVGSGEIDGKEYFYRGDSVVSRPSMPCSISKDALRSDGVDTISIVGLPSPCTVTLDSIKHTVIDGVFEFSIDQPGAYTIRAESFPCKPVEFPVVAT